MKERIKYEDCNCDEGACWNNADKTSGQWVPCPDCEMGLTRTEGDDIVDLD